MRESHPAHDHAALILLLLVVVRLVAHSDFLLLDSPSEFAVHMETGAGLGQGAGLEDPAHVVEQVSDRQHDRGRAEIVSLLQEELSILISLGGGSAEPVHRLGLVVSYSLPRQIQLAQ